MNKIKQKIIMTSVLALALTVCCLALGACGANGVKKLILGKADSFFIVGDEFGGVPVQVTYNDDTVENLTLDETCLTGFDTTVAGKKTVVVTYEGKTVDWKIEVCDLYVDSLAVKEGSADTFVRGMPYRDGQIVLIAGFTDQTSREVEVTADMISFSVGNAGVVPAEIRYQGMSLTHTVTVREPNVSSAVVDVQTKTRYRYGDAFDKVVLNVAYENGETEVAEITDEGAVDGFDTSVVGSKTVTVTYKDYQTNFAVEVLKKAVSLQVKDYTEFCKKDSEFDDRGVIEITYHDETTESIALTDSMLTGFDTSKYGKHTIAAAYEDLTAEFEIVVSLVNASGDYKMQAEDYAFCNYDQSESTADTIFEEVSKTGNGNEVVPNGAEGSSTANLSKKGNKIVVTFYSAVEGTFVFGTRAQSASGSGKQDQLLSEVVSLTVNGQAQAAQGTLHAASTTGGGWTNMVNWTTIDVTGSMNLVKGENTVVIESLVNADANRFPNFDYFTLKTERKAASISVREESRDAFVRDGSYTDGDIVLNVTYDDESHTKVPVTASMISLDLTKTGNITAAIRYAGLSIDYEVTVRAAAVTAATVNAQTKTQYTVADVFEKIVLDVTYENGKTGIAEITDAGQVTGFDTASAGDKNCSVTYRGFEITFTIHVEKAIGNIKSLIVKNHTETYGLNDSFGQGTLAVTYEDDTAEDVAMTAEMLENFDTSEYGTKTVTVTYGNKSAEFDILVASVTVAGEYKIQAEDTAFCDYSQAESTNTTTGAKFESTTTPAKGDAYPNGAEGESTANLSKVGNKVVIKFWSAVEGTFAMGTKAQSASGKGLNDQALSGVISMTVNENTQTVSGTVKAGSATKTGWKDMTVWTEVAMTESIALVKGENTVVIECLVGGDTMRFPNFDYFTLTVA